MTRPRANASLADLKDLFKSNKDSAFVLEQLFEELVERKSRGARALLAEVSGRLAELEAEPDDPDLPADGPVGQPEAVVNELPTDADPPGPHPDDQETEAADIDPTARDRRSSGCVAAPAAARHCAQCQQGRRLARPLRRGSSRVSLRDETERLRPETIRA